MKRTLIYVVYDGIENSVFASQVLAPLRAKLAAGTYQQIILISFEKKKYTSYEIEHIVKPNDQLQCIILKKTPFLGILTLYPAIYQLRALLKKQPSHAIIARSALAGYICLKARQPTTISLTIQARGLLAAEYEFTNRTTNPLPKIFHQFRAQQFFALEKKTYSPKNSITIEAVGPALAEYLFTTFNTKSTQLCLAHEDIPPHIDQQQIAEWKITTRTALGITPHAYVYCYNGSIKPWQCPDKIIDFFMQQLHTNPTVFLLVITQDAEEFTQYLQKKGTPHTNYYVCSVLYNSIYQYLAAADAGLVFRELHVVNWTSRPTKVLEYQAVGLHIIHNNTVAWMCNLPNTTAVEI
jgi:hypothetical protein